MRETSRRGALFRLVASLLLLAPVPAAAQVPDSAGGAGAMAEPAGTARVVPGARYAASRLHARLLGDAYRDLWTTAVAIPVLDLDGFAGGLRPIRRGGGRQTASLRLLGADGREYSFRSVAKHPWMARHPDLRGALLGDLIQDQSSSILPAAGLLVPPLAAAAGVLTTEPRLYRMPDHPVLGEFRPEFAGMLGTLEEHADEREDGGPGFGGFARIVATETMLEELEEDPSHRVDERAYLTARLLDLVIGDWDRHGDQWRWARIDEPGGTRWLPIARDHDYAFSDYDGLLLHLVRRAAPNAVRFRGEYRDLPGLVMNADTLDRRLLAWLERPVWDSVALALRDRLSDASIEAALQRMPAEHRARRGEELRARLHERRERLPEAAAAFYRHLASLAEIHATDAAERLEVTRRPDGSVEVRVGPRDATAGGAGGERARTFSAAETREIRLYLHGGDDHAEIRGAAGEGIRVRVIGGGGRDRLVDAGRVARRGRWTSLHDHGEGDTLVGGPGTVLDRRAYRPPPASERTLIRLLPRDHGGDLGLYPVADYSTTRGVLLGAGVSATRYAFRHHPYRRLLRADLRVAPGWAGAELRAAARFQAADPALSTRVDVLVSGIDALRFHGFGNEAAAELPASAYVVRRDALVVEAALRRVVAGGLTFSAGPRLQLHRPHESDGSALATLRPRGWDGSAAAGAGGRLELRRAIGGLDLLAATGTSVNHAFRGTRGTFGDVDALGALLLPLGRGWTEGRVGGRLVWGEAPFHEAAFLGGDRTLRGYREWRFAGDAMAHGTLEAGVVVGRLPLLLNWRTGVFTFVDAGRVWLNGEDSGRWHSAAGAGLELGALGRTVRISYARGESGRLYLETRTGRPR